MTAHRWTDSGKPIPYPSGTALGSDAPPNPAHSPCVLCGVPAGELWDGLALCGKCEEEMVEELREPTCVDCGESFVPVAQSQRRCKWCNAVKLMG